MAEEKARDPTMPERKPVNIPLSKIHDLPGSVFAPPSPKSLEALTSSIVLKGIQEPVILRQREDGEFQIVSGNRRRKASELAKKTEIPAFVYDMTEKEARDFRLKDNAQGKPPGKLLTEAEIGKKKDTKAVSVDKPDVKVAKDTQQDASVLPKAAGKELPKKPPAKAQEPPRGQPKSEKTTSAPVPSPISAYKDVSQSAWYYGYKRINGDKQTLVVDEPAAEIVRKVFRLACQGMGVTAIAEQLTEEKVLIPSAYTAKYFPENCRNRSFSDPYRWNANTIGHILDRQEYLGHTVLGKSICENFKTKQRRAATPEELMIFPDTHEAIIDQDTWDIAQKLRVRAKPRAANGTYSHRLSGMIYCADCGSRMGFISPEARQSGKHYDSDSAFQCGNYRNQNNECVSHFIKTSALEAAILQAIKAVSQYVIENEAEFISQLKTVWNESKSKSANNGQQEIDEAKKRMAELDAKIQKLYDSAISGLLPERQAQRMIQQYDEEQLMLEKRVEELQGQIQEEEVEKIDTNRFIALVNKYRNCEELTDTMLYAFIDRVEVHEATGGRTVYRQQNIDIYFNFIGNYYPPVETVSEEERIAAIEAEQLRKKQEKAKRAAEVQKQKKAALMKAVEAGDPEAIAEYERKLALQRERNHRRQQKIKEAREADPAYIAQMEEKERLQREKLLEAERKRTERANRQKKLSRKELKEAAKTDPKAAEEWQALKEKEAVARQRKKEREEERMAADPEYAAMMAERKAEYTRTRTAKRQAEREALVELAKTDEEAAKKLAEMRKYQSQATVRSYQKMKADAEAGDPDAIKRYETTLAKRREEYHRKKGA